MGREQPESGRDAEHLARAQIRPLFLEVDLLIDTSRPWDLNARGLLSEPTKQARADLNLHGTADLVFHIEVKSARSRPRVEIARDTFTNWIGVVEKQPIVILHVEDVQEPAWRFLMLHPWLARHANDPASWLLDSGTVRISLDEFEPVGDGWGRLHAALRREGERASGYATAVYGTLRDYGLFPVNEGQLLQHPELASILEPPREVVRVLGRPGRLSIPIAVARILRAASPPDDPVLAEWRNFVITRRQLDLPLGASQLARFFQTVEAFRQGELLALPRYHVSETSAWRAYASMYPYAALPLLREVILKSPRVEDIVFASAVLPAPAYAQDPFVRTSAHEILGLLRDRAGLSWNDTRSYRIQRELNRGLAEGGFPEYQERAIRVITRRDSFDFELHHLRTYGWSDDTIEANIRRKLDHPAMRDEALVDFMHAMDAVLGKRIRQLIGGP